MKVGLRFRRGDARVLEGFAHSVKSGALRGITSASIFEQAAIAARSGEPLTVICDDVDEVRQMAALYATLGIREPSIESLPS